MSEAIPLLPPMPSCRGKVQLGACDLRFGALDKEMKPAVWILGYFSGIKIHAESYHCAGSGVRQLPL